MSTKKQESTHIQIIILQSCAQFFLASYMYFITVNKLATNLELAHAFFMHFVHTDSAITHHLNIQHRVLEIMCHFPDILALCQDKIALDWTNCLMKNKEQLPHSKVNY